MTKDEKQTLDRLLTLYFAENDLNDRNFKHRDSTIRILKAELTKLKHWKALPRRKPVVGRRFGRPFKAQ